MYVYTATLIIFGNVFFWKSALVLHFHPTVPFGQQRLSSPSLKASVTVVAAGFMDLGLDFTAIYDFFLDHFLYFLCL